MRSAPRLCHFTPRCRGGAGRLCGDASALRFPSEAEVFFQAGAARGPAQSRAVTESAGRELSSHSFPSPIARRGAARPRQHGAARPGRGRARRAGRPLTPANGGRPGPAPGSGRLAASRPSAEGRPRPADALRFSWARTVQPRQWELRRAPRRAGWRRQRRCGEAAGRRQARGAAGDRERDGARGARPAAGNAAPRRGEGGRSRGRAAVSSRGGGAGGRGRACVWRRACGGGAARGGNGPWARGAGPCGRGRVAALSPAARRLGGGTRSAPPPARPGAGVFSRPGRWLRRSLPVNGRERRRRS